MSKGVNEKAVFHSYQTCPRCETEKLRMTVFNEQMQCYMAVCEECGKSFRAVIGVYGDVGDFRD